MLTVCQQAASRANLVGELDDGGKDIFVHATAIEQAGIPPLIEGQKVSYELATDRGKTSASELKVVG